ncbi:hypothetical protein QYE76_068153 [Lolium multiflorum]|uniref:Gag-pol polyprotein n=1 Tax=Lolium multiflorum TaxID=4521 RepID=A0AAD8SEX2_LOLMU|nr:hypothetical protein QYE76_068153 [Lolium multiflorum]
MKFGLDQLQGLVRSYLNNRYQEETSIARGEEQLDMKTDVKRAVKLDMELDMKISHGRARRSGRNAREKKKSRPVQPENKNSADIVTWREYEALRNEMRREFRTKDDELKDTVDEIKQTLDATNITVTGLADQMTDIQRTLADMRLTIENLTTQQQQDDDEDPELEDDAHNARGAPHGHRPRGRAPLGRNGRGQDEEDGLGKPKFSIPKFEGGADVEEYLTWELKIEKLWSLHPNYSEDKKIKLASSEFDGYALRWWDSLIRNRDEDGAQPIRTWRAMKEVMTSRFVPTNYMRNIFDKLTLLRQGVKTVDEYYMEMEMLMQRGRVRESLEMTMQRFLNGLKYDVKGIVRHYTYTDMNQLLHHAKKLNHSWLKKQRLKDVLRKWAFTPARPLRRRPAVSSVPYSTPPSKPVSNVSNAKKSESAASTSGSSVSTTRNRDMLCHTCGGKGHFKRDCPNRKVMFINEDNEYETGDDVDPNAPDDDDYDTDGEDAYPSDARTIVVSQRALNVLPSASTQRCNLFQTKALVGPDKACKVIIDGGSCRNLASKELCTKLKLKYLPHPHPYYIQWLSDNGEMKVNHMVRVEFEIGPYKDCIDFDVVPMTVCHLLLGRPWLYDRSVQHNGRANTYHLEYKGKKINLQPMSPQQIVNESRQKIEVNLEDASIDRRENCNVVSDITKSERVNSLVSLATKEDMREFSEDPTAMPLVLLYRGTVLVSNDMTPLPLGVSSVLQEFGDVFPEEVPAGLPPLRGIEHQIDLIPEHRCPIGRHIALIPKRRRRYRSKYKRYSTKESHAGGLMGHFGREKTLLMLADHFYWPKMRRDVDRYVRRCITCNKSKSKLKPHGRYILPLCPFEVVYGFKPITPLDLLPLPIHERVNMEASKRADFVKTKELIEKKAKSNAARMNKKRKEMLFKPGDLTLERRGRRLLKGGDDEDIPTSLLPPSLPNEDEPAVKLKYQEETSIARGEEQLDMKTDVKRAVKLDMELDMKISHGRAREEREECARGEEEVQAGPEPDDDCDSLELFRAATCVQLGNRAQDKFWIDNWIPNKLSVKESILVLFSYVRDSEISVVVALAHRRWARDISGGLSSQAIAQYLHLWDIAIETTLVNSEATLVNSEADKLRAVAITDHVPVKLSTTAANYLAWKTYFYLLFREYNLRDHIDGTADLLACDSDWLAIDATIIRWLFLTVSPDIFKTVVREGDDARTVWGKINGLFTNNKLQRVVFLQQEFFGTPQGDQTLDAYCLRLKAISDELQDLGFRIGDELLLSTLTAGLNEDLGNAASNLTLMTNPTFERAVDYLRLEERRLKGVRTRAVHTALWASGNSVLPHGGGAPPAPTPAPPHPAPQPQQHQGGGGGGRGRRRGRGGGRGGGNNGGPGIVGPRPGYSHPTPPWAGGHNPWTGVVHAYTMPVPRPPVPGTVGPRPPTHQAFIAAPPQAPAGLPYAPVYGGMMPQAPPAHWDPALYTALQHAPSPGAYSGGGDWFMDTGASAHMAAHPVSVKTLSRDNSVTVEFDEFGFSFGRPILALQTDNGKEFDNTTIRTLLSTHGTIFRLTCPYTSQQNGRAEREQVMTSPPVTDSPRRRGPTLVEVPGLAAPARSLYYSCDASRDALEHYLGLTRGTLEPR